MRKCINHSLLSVKLVLLWILDIILSTYFLYLCEHNKTIILYNIFVIHFELIFIYWSKFDFCLWIISSSVSVVENNILSLLNCLSPLPKIQLTMHSWMYILGPLFFSINLFVYHNATVSWVLFSMTVMS